MKKAVKIFFVISLILFLLIICYKKEKSPLETKFPLFLFQIQSGSMMPEIKIGEVIVLWKSKKYEEKDIITYKENGSYFVTHRIIKVTQDGYITKGDFNNTEDETIVKQEQIQGKVIFHSQLLGKIYEFRYYLIAILIFLIFI